MTTTDVDIADEIVLEALAAAAQIPSIALKDVETVSA